MVLGRIRELFSGPDDARPGNTDAAARSAPPEPAGDPGGPSRQAQSRKKSVLRRDAILGRDSKVAGYGFALRDAPDARLREAPLAVHRLYNEALLANLDHPEVLRLLERRQAFIPVSPLLLEHPLLAKLPAERVMWMLERTEDFPESGETLRTRIESLRHRGFRFAISAPAVRAPGAAHLGGLAELVLLDAGDEDIPAITASLAAAAKQVPGARFMATGIRSHEMFETCRKLQFALFQGDFVTRRERWDSPAMSASRVKVLDLMNRVRKGAEQSALAAQIKLDPVLSVRLLRYVNSPGMGLLNKVGGIEQALMVIGRDKLYRWLTMVLFTGGQGGELDSALLENALVRGRLAEAFASRILSRREQDEVFVAGLFSLLDVVLRMPMADVLKQISLPEAVEAALRDRSGPYAPFLELALACENDDAPRVEALAGGLQLDLAEVNEAQVGALIWAQEAEAA